MSHLESRPSAEPARSGLGVEALKRDIIDNLTCLQGCYPAIATPHYWYMTLAFSVRDRMMARRVATAHAYVARDAKVACDVGGIPDRAAAWQ